MYGTGQGNDKFTPAEIASLKTVTFDKDTGKQIGGKYYSMFSKSVRRYLRSPESIANKLRIVKNKFIAKDRLRDAAVKGHRRTMNPMVEAALDRLILNAPHLYDVGDPYIPTGLGAYGFPSYLAARGTNFTESINSLFPVLFARGSHYSMTLAVAIILSAIVVYNTDRRRAAKLELDFIHYDRALVVRVNELSARMLGRALYDGPRPEDKLRKLLPDDGTRFVANVDYAEFQPLARLVKRNRIRLGKRRAEAAARASDDHRDDLGSETRDVSPRESSPPREPAQEREPAQPAQPASTLPSGRSPRTKATKVLLKHPVLRTAAGARNAKAAYVAARKDKSLQCSAECQAHKREHVKRHADKPCPARGFHHLGTCPVKLAADAARRP